MDRYYYYRLDTSQILLGDFWLQMYTHNIIITIRYRNIIFLVIIFFLCAFFTGTVLMCADVLFLHRDRNEIEKPTGDRHRIRLNFGNRFRNGQLTGQSALAIDERLRISTSTVGTWHWAFERSAVYGSEREFWLCLGCEVFDVCLCVDLSFSIVVNVFHTFSCLVVVIFWRCHWFRVSSIARFTDSQLSLPAGTLTTLLKFVIIIQTLFFFYGRDSSLDDDHMSFDNR